MSITFSGIGSGLDIDGLVTQLVAAERQAPEYRLARQEAEKQYELSAFGALKSAMSTLQSGLSGLNSLSSYGNNKITSSDSAKVAVSVDSKAAVGDYAIEVSQLAEKHSLASGVFADKDETALGTGTLTIRFGETDYNSGTDTYNSFTLNSEANVATIDIDPSNNTLEGIRDAINDADVGVNAAIVNDGTGYRLLINSEETGLQNSLEITVDDTTDADNVDNSVGLSRFAFNSAATNMEQTIAAEDALLTINGLDVASSDNVVSDALEGVKLTLKSVTDSVVDVAVLQDKGPTVAAMNRLINGYNSFMQTVNGLSSYDAETKVAGALLGDFTLRSMEDQLGDVLRTSVAGIAGDFSNLAELGVTTLPGGILQLDSEKFDEMLDNKPDDVAAVFAAIAIPTDASISFEASSGETSVGDYAVDITQIASAGYLAGSGVLPDFGGGGTLTIDNDNDNFDISINGVDGGSISLTQGVYNTGASLADELQARINGATEFSDAGITVTVSYDDVADTFTISSNSLGSESKVEITAVDTNTAATLGFSVATGVDGLDVEGTIGGEAATGTGDVLLGDEGTLAEGLALHIAGDTLGSRGTVNFTRGISDQLNTLLTNLLSEESVLASRIDGLETTIERIGESREALDLRMQAVEIRYRNQFNALDALLGQLNSTSEYLAGQLANLPKPRTTSFNSN